MIFEDVHWIDPTSLEVLGRTVDLVKTLPALLIVTFRPEFNAPWVGQSHVTSLTLNRLRQHEVGAIDRASGRKGRIYRQMLWPRSWSAPTAFLCSWKR